MSETVNLSTKGQIVIPKAIRDRLGLTPGARLVIETEGRTIRISEAPRFAPTRLEDVAGCLKYDGPPVSPKEMDEALDRWFAERHDFD
jgi:AbrB family looped-hinge helix DNA binding protein